MSDDFDNDYESYDDFDSGFDGGDSEPVNAEAESVSEIDAIADLLAGDSTKADALTKDGGRKSNKDVGTSMAVDGNGRMDFGDDAPAQRNQNNGQQEWSISGTETGRAMQAAAHEMQRAEAANRELTARYQRGEITDEDYYNASHALGQHYGQHNFQYMQARLNAHDHREQKLQAYDHLNAQFPGEFQGEKLRENLTECVGWLSEQGLAEYAHDVEDPRVVAGIYRAMTSIKENDSLRGKVAQQAAQIRRLKEAAGVSRKRGHRAAEKGGTTEKSLSQVMDILSKAGHSGSGR